MAWSVPAVALATAAPSFATSRNAVSATICNLFYGGGTTNAQTHSIYLGVSSSEGFVPKGTTLTWTIKIGNDPSGRPSMSPTTNYSAVGAWTLTVSPTRGTTTDTVTVTLTFNQDYPLGGAGVTWCAPALIWNDTYILRPQAPVTITSNGTVTANQGTVLGGSLKYTVARRYPANVNDVGRVPHVYTSKSGVMSCYPSIQWSRILPGNGYDNVTTYPAGTAGIPSACTWGTTSCNTSGGMSTPLRNSTAQTTQYVTAALC